MRGAAAAATLNSWYSGLWILQLLFPFLSNSPFLSSQKVFCFFHFVLSLVPAWWKDLFCNPDSSNSAKCVWNPNYLLETALTKSQTLKPNLILLTNHLSRILKKRWFLTDVRFLTMFSNLVHILCSKMKMTSRTVQTCSQWEWREVTGGKVHVCL